MPVRKNVVIVNPAFEPATEYGYPYIERIYKNIKDFYNVGYCPKDDAVKDIVWSKIKELDPLSLVLFGHGNTNVYTGQNYNIIFRVGEVPKELVEGRIFLVLSCLTAKELGKHFVEDLGAWAYLGWEEEYGFWVSHIEEFLGTISTAWSKLFLGELPSIGDVYDYIYKKYTEYYEKYKEKEPDVAEWFLWDRDYMRVIGDKNAHVVKEVKIYHTKIHSQHTVEDTKISWEEREASVKVKGYVEVVETGERLKDVVLKVKVFLDGRLDTEFDVPVKEGGFDFEYDRRLDTFEHTIQIKIILEGFDRSNEVVERYVGDEHLITVRLPLLKTKTKIIAWTEKVKKKSTSMPYSTYNIVVGFKVVDEHGNIINVEEDEFTVEFRDATGYSSGSVKKKDSTFSAESYDLLIPTIRTKPFLVECSITYKPRDPRYAPAYEVLWIPIESNVNWKNPTVWIIILIILLLAGLLSTNP